MKNKKTTKETPVESLERRMKEDPEKYKRIRIATPEEQEAFRNGHIYSDQRDKVFKELGDPSLITIREAIYDIVEIARIFGVKTLEIPLNIKAKRGSPLDEAQKIAPVVLKIIYPGITNKQLARILHQPPSGIRRRIRYVVGNFCKYDTQIGTIVKRCLYKQYECERENPDGQRHLRPVELQPR